MSKSSEHLEDAVGLLARRLLSLPDCGPQALATTAWAMAILRLEDQPLLQQISQHAPELHSWKPRDLTTLVWAFASLAVQDSTLRAWVSQG
mmetsp:Transcript_47652/g.89182  ORF Transcript_47652/g.89182 Transcript_47652/m.89182 type:complete len:91 (-) Transcript_47652:97-369(-)